jgi:hypothetical protein
MKINGIEVIEAVTEISKESVPENNNKWREMCLNFIANFGNAFIAFVIFSVAGAAGA